jgi:hypothetical protein
VGSFGVRIKREGRIMDLSGLESLIESGAKELALDREALSRLKQRYPEYFEPKREQFITFGEAPVGAMEVALQRIMSSESREWTSSELCDRLEDEAFPMNKDRNIRMGKLGETLSAMAGRTITQVEKGVGRRPSRYKWGVAEKEDAA